MLNQRIVDVIGVVGALDRIMSRGAPRLSHPRAVAQQVAGDGEDEAVGAFDVAGPAAGQHAHEDLLHQVLGVGAAGGAAHEKGRQGTPVARVQRLPRQPFEGLILPEPQPRASHTCVRV